MQDPFECSEYVLLVITVPETHADLLRETLGNAGAGETEGYTHCSFTYRGIGRFMPKNGARPFIGKIGELEEVVEEQIETICRRDRLEKVVEAIKRVHPYEETVILIHPIYNRGIKKQTPSASNQEA